MADKVGTVECFDFSGQPPGVEEAVDAEYVPGYGVEMWTTGRFAGPFRLVLRFINETLDAYESKVADLRDSAGGAGVTVSKADGRCWDRCFIGAPAGEQAVREASVRHVLNGAGEDCVNAMVEVSGHRVPE